MLCAGVDLSASAQRTTALAIEWDAAGRGRVGFPESGLGDAALLERLGPADWTGIAAPFGWPREMVASLYEQARTGRWPGLPKERFRYRRTDLFVHAAVARDTGDQLWPLSVSSERVALTAWRVAGLRELAFERSGVRFDRAGEDGVVEVYPLAALSVWGLEASPRALSASKEATTAREALVVSLEGAAPWLDWSPGARDGVVERPDALVALTAALVARAAASGLTRRPPVEDVEAAAEEGWIHLPEAGSLPALAAPAGAVSAAAA